MIAFSVLLFLAALAVLVIGIRTVIKREGEALDRRNSYVQSFGLALALIAAGIQFIQQSRTESQQSRDAITRILLTAYDPGDVDSAFGALTNAQSVKAFDAAARVKFRDEVGTLTSYFWTVNTCVRSKICDAKSALETFCADYLRYSSTFELANGQKETTATFGPMEELEKCPRPTLVAYGDSHDEAIGHNRYR